MANKFWNDKTEERKVLVLPKHRLLSSLRKNGYKTELKFEAIETLGGTIYFHSVYAEDGRELARIYRPMISPIMPYYRPKVQLKERNQELESLARKFADIYIDGAKGQPVKIM